MNRNLIIQSVLIIMILSACTGQSPAASPTATAGLTETIPVTGATVTEPPAAANTMAAGTQEASAATPSSTPTPEATRPPNAADCTNNASFVADLTIPDNTEIAGGATFTKTWQVMNNGTCIWASDYTLTYYSEERMNAPASVPLSVTYPGQTANISITLTAPNSVGTHRGNFVIKNPKGLIMKMNGDSRLWLIINVKNISAATVAPTATGGVAAQVTPTTASSSGAGLANPTCAFSIDQTRLTDVITAVNAYRAQFNMPAYTVNPQLARAAQAHASDIACNQLFGHTGSNGSTIQSRIAATGYAAAYSSENVYGSYPPLSGPDVVNWWVNDKTDQNHRLNLVSDTYIEIGVGYAFFNNYGYYVIVFATP